MPTPEAPILHRRQFIQTSIGAGAVLALGESCGTQEIPQQTIAREFVSALASGNLPSATNYFAPDIRHDPSLKQYLSQLAQQIKGCEIEEVVVRESRLGLGVTDNAVVTFRKPCGQGQGRLSNMQFQAIEVGLGKANHEYYIHPLAIGPVPVSRVDSKVTTKAITPEKRETTPPVKILPFRVEVSQARPMAIYRPYPAPTRSEEASPKPEEGWKWVSVLYGVENSASQSHAVPKFSATLVTNEGFEYKQNEDISDGVDLVVLPPHFRTIGVWSFGGYGELNAARFAQRLFKIAEKTTPSKLKITGFPDVDLTRGIVDVKNLKFPTDRLDSDFEKFGTEISVGNKGKIAFVDVNEVPKPGSYNKNGMGIVLRLGITNASLGGNTTFSLNFPGIFSNDGIFYQSGERLNVSVGPGLSKEYQLVLWMPQKGVQGKLPVAGDVTKIFNLNF